jgi:hypothetical protein
MASLSILYVAQRTKIGAIELDASISESHSGTVQATAHQVERGAKITDHLRPEPDILTIEGLVTNTPINLTQQTRAVSFGGVEFTTTATAPAIYGVPGYAEEAFAKLQALKNAGELVTVVTAIKTYEDMALTSLQVPRDRSTGDALRFSATFQQIRIVQNKVTQIRPNTDPRANRKAKAGRTVLGKIQHASKTLRKTTAPWNNPDIPEAQRKEMVEKFKPVGRVAKTVFFLG